MPLQIDPITGQPFWSEDTSIAGDPSTFINGDPYTRSGEFGGFSVNPEYVSPLHISNAIAPTASEANGIGFSDLARLLETGATAYINLDRARTALEISKNTNAMARAASRNILADPMFMIAVAGLLVALLKS